MRSCVQNMSLVIVELRVLGLMFLEGRRTDLWTLYGGQRRKSSLGPAQFGLNYGCPAAKLTEEPRSWKMS